MSIIRKANKNKFTSVSNALIAGSGLSFACRGMLVYLLSKPDDWECRVTDLEREGNIGETARRSIMREAEEKGFLTFERTRTADGRFSSTYFVHEEAIPENERTKSWETTTIKPTPGKPVPGKSTPGQQGGIVITDLLNTDLLNTENIRIHDQPEKQVEKPLSPNGDAPLKKPKGDVQQVIDRYSELFTERFKEKPQINGGKDGANIKRIIAQYGVGKVIFYLETYFNSKDKFFAEKGFTLAIFYSNLNTIIASTSKQQAAPAPARSGYVDMSDPAVRNSPFYQHVDRMFAKQKEERKNGHTLPA